MKLGAIIWKISATACCGALLWASPAAADGWPMSVAGNWTVKANLASGSMFINQPASTRQCKPITGTIFGSPIEGAYCPGSGRITFFRYLNAERTASQFYSANLSQDTPSLTMAGSFATRSDSGNPGEYSFYATE